MSPRLALLALLLVGCAPSPDLVAPPDDCEADCWDRVEAEDWSSTEYEACRAECGEEVAS